MRFAKSDDCVKI